MISLNAFRLCFVALLLGLCLCSKLNEEPLGLPTPNLACQNPPIGQCGFYAHCLESRYHCGPEGYPIGYGQHFCQRFLDNITLFDARGQQWMIDVMHCLQLELVGDAVDAIPPSLTCEALEDEAFASHAGCYTRNGFCTLGVHNWAVVLEIVDIKTLFSSWDALKATVETAAECTEFYIYMVERALL